MVYSFIYVFVHICICVQGGRGWKKKSLYRIVSVQQQEYFLFYSACARIHLYSYRIILFFVFFFRNIFFFIQTAEFIVNLCICVCINNNAVRISIDNSVMHMRSAIFFLLSVYFSLLNFLFFLLFSTVMCSLHSFFFFLCVQPILRVKDNE